MSKATWVKWAIQFLTIQLRDTLLGGGIEVSVAQRLVSERLIMDLSEALYD